MRARNFPMAALLFCSLASCWKSEAPPAPSFSVVTPTQQPSSQSAWTEATITALRSEGVLLADTVPTDIDNFCPGYAAAPKAQRQAFWTGFFTHLVLEDNLAKGIANPRTPSNVLSGRDCSNSAFAGLSPYQSEMSCAVVTMAQQVVQDGAVVGDKGGWLGIARGWLPLRDKSTRQGIAAWTSSQPYCG